MYHRKKQKELPGTQAWLFGVILSGSLEYLFLLYGTETWAMKKASLHSLERTERMMLRWMCGVSLKDRKRSVHAWICSLLGVQSVAEVVRRGRLRWFRHVSV